MTDGVFTERARRALIAAFTAARSMGHSCLASEHMLLGLCGQPGDRAAEILQQHSVSRAVLEEKVSALWGRGRGGFASQVTRECADVLEYAARLGSPKGEIDTVHILSAILRMPVCGGYRLLQESGVEPAQLLLGLDRPIVQQKPKSRRNAEPKLLQQYGVDMTAKAAKGEYDPMIGREEELQRVIRILCRRRKANPVLLGEAGVGKTAIAEGLAARLAGGRVPSPLREMRLFSIDMAAMVAGTKYRGEFEDKVRGLVDEVAACGNILLFIDEIHTVAGAGAAEGAIDAGNILKPALARGDLRILGATTPAEYRKYIEKDAALERRFQPVDVNEPDRSATMAILRASAVLCRAHCGADIDEELLTEIENLCRRFLPDRRFPDKAIDVLDEAAALALTEGSRRVSRTHIRRVLAQMSGLPTLIDSNTVDPEALMTHLQRSVIGQDAAVQSAVSAACAAMAFPGRRSRPQGILLFCGPSGTGKTLLAKKLAEGLFGSEDALKRFDMSEYREPHSVARLIGAPPGYSGYGQGGLLTEAVRRRPFSVLLFDEIEKAHPEVLSLLLQLLEDGVLTDSEGRTADFKSAIVILTSNIGGQRFSGRQVGFAADTHRVDRALSQHFAPELLSRIDRVMYFDPPNGENREKIAQKLLLDLQAGLQDAGIRLTWDDGLPAALAAKTRDGREIRTAIRREIEEPAARLCLEGCREMAVCVEETEIAVCAAVPCI